jgi:hypothetical protein
MILDVMHARRWWTCKYCMMFVILESKGIDTNNNFRSNAMLVTKITPSYGQTTADRDSKQILDNKIPPWYPWLA